MSSFQPLSNDSGVSPDDLAQLTELLRRIGPQAQRVFSGAMSLPSPPLEPDLNIASLPPASQHPSLSYSVEPTGLARSGPPISNFHSLPHSAGRSQLLPPPPGPPPPPPSVAPVFQPSQLASARLMQMPATRQSQDVSSLGVASQILPYRSPRTEMPMNHMVNQQSFPAAPNRQTLSHIAPAMAASLSQSRPASGRRISSLATQSVNRDRLNAASTHRAASQGIRSRRGTRGPAVQPPALRQNPLDSCYVDLGPGLGTQLAITVKVYPPKILRSRSIYYYRFHKDSVDAFLEEMHLLYRYNVPAATTSIVDVIQSVISDLQNSPARYRFNQGPSGSVIPHELLPLQLLCFNDRGRIRASDRSIRLREEPATRSLTVEKMAANIFLFAPRTVQSSVENNRFVIHLFAWRSPLIGQQPTSSGAPDGRMHSCISKKMYNRFPTDDPDAVLAPGPMGFDNDTCSEASGNDGSESEGDTDVDIPEVLPSVLVNHSIGLQRHPTIGVLPSSIWDITWTSNRGSAPNRYTLENFSTHILEHANLENDSKLSISGIDMPDIVQNLLNALQDAASQGDFTKILSPDREFLIMQENPQGGRSQLVSLGEGVEREVLYSAFASFLSESSKWLQPRVDGSYTIATTLPARAAKCLSEKRMQNLQVFGALTSLLIINQICPSPLSPLFLHFLIHGSQLQSLHKALVAEWHPELASTIQQWIDMGHTGNPQPFESHFASYHDMQIGCLQDRSQEGHYALAAEMLYRAIIGSESPDHPEILAFYQGFRLPCKGRFCFIDAMKSFAGGSESLLSLLWASHIKSFDDIEIHLRFRTPLDTVLIANFTGIFPVPSLEHLFRQFLQGSGIVCPGLFASAKLHFSPIIDLSGIDDVSFRSKMFCWAVSGSPTIELASASILVYLIGDNDPNYAPSSNRTSMLAEGKVAFKTCFKQAYFPASWLAKLAKAEYDGILEPRSLQEAIHYWFLTEILNAIGSHTML